MPTLDACPKINICAPMLMLPPNPISINPMAINIGAISLSTNMTGSNKDEFASLNSETLPKLAQLNNIVLN